MSTDKPKGILKKPSINFQTKTPKLKWDEDNIQLTEAQKNSTMKVTEPKTPYIHYNQETDEIMTDLEKIPGLALSSNNSNQGSSSVSPIGSVSPSAAHFPDSIKDDWDSENSEEDEETKIKRKKFAELRAKHYNMKEALRLGHKLVDEDVDEEENGNAAALNEENEIDNKDYDNSSSNNGVPMET
ncbi:hypothetical protein RhiirA5_455739 [Rhizophagus irregularis]|uniref:Protein phosphatase inhibitor 2 n=3 Tax=Rhizophagus irregularis TaxID=588596 RepID=A0A2I1ELY0_9GLOM|nr:hypothetical protein GLOIN_2v1623457 [Rhizophagus irregularis DAOM 181602=DAOM 197198]EXX61947.1 hypothetical protein RirG_166400 [Rhizophagus irregularis DAOM 197198w]PKC14133.1 hypothetical protein RhiirA5_455739 [Rhizophagus irregularis]PKC73280.1 hypothetical protein RhiirA1_389040 [Rhizophagus irregularis]PKK62120.1 hypothetical protein RhiirC2_759957 [Rhizophagus irregularis]PKY23140.1 hypothetical protein RhiirB3_504974 [Rhizophagus irregularis]|eukprot:XP_025176553.1 hypothetical protein GLOIN_2v1623457 [Rhizophagus irregularis DAOM 181602=DAOM 197198]